MKNITILGSTGSIGVQALNIIKNHRDEFNLIGISANENVDLLLEQAKLYNPKYVCIANEEYRDSLNKSLDSGLKNPLLNLIALMPLGVI